MSKFTNKAVNVETTVLPPDGKGTAPTGARADQASDASRIVARWMDDFIRIPGTQRRIGLDPIMGLFPGVGDFLASSMGLILLIEGVKSRLPLSVLIRMGANILVNNIAGAVPVAGDAFSFWFKSNSRNLALLNRWKTGDQKSLKRSSRLFLAGFIVIWTAFIALWVFVWLAVAGVLYSGLKQLLGF